MVKEPKYKGQKPISANRYDINPNRPFLVKGLLLEGQVGMIAGEPNLGKSAIMACIASHVAMGRNIGDMKVNRAAVLYLASPASNMVTGDSLKVDGGWTAI